MMDDFTDTVEIRKFLGSNCKIGPIGKGRTFSADYYYLLTALCFKRADSAVFFPLITQPYLSALVCTLQLHKNGPVFQIKDNRQRLYVEFAWNLIFIVSVDLIKC